MHTVFYFTSLFFLTCKHVACKYENGWAWRLSWQSTSLFSAGAPRRARGEKSVIKTKVGHETSCATAGKSSIWASETGRGGSFTWHPSQRNLPPIPLLYSTPLPQHTLLLRSVQSLRSSALCRFSECVFVNSRIPLNIRTCPLAVVDLWRWSRVY